MPPGEANRWQSAIIDQILSDYRDKKFSSTIISGPPGCGKTTLGVLVARMIKSVGVEPELVGNMDFQIPDMDLSSAYGHPSAVRPTILMLNEFDGAIKYAERSREGQNGASKNCLADTPSSLLNAIDFMSKTRYLIIIATSNLKIKELTSGIYERYFRQGRFNNHYEVRGSKAVKSAPPGLCQNNSAARHK
jgi:DNA polymerase III delta prime subunit